MHTYKTSHTADNAAFQEACPVWPEGRSDVWNQLIGWYTGFSLDDASEKAILRRTAADSCRGWCNGQHGGYGPARTAHGFARVDEWDLTSYLKRGENHLAIEVLWHGIDSYATILQPPFLQAELLRGDTVLASTPSGFQARSLPFRVQKVERFSKQRPFAEAYHLTEGCNQWREGRGLFAV